jgi:putative membrane protein
VLTVFLLTWIATAVTFILATQISTGIESDDLVKSFKSSLVFGFVNALTVLILWHTQPNIFMFTLISLLENTLLLSLSPRFIKGFRLRWDIISAILGGLMIAVVNSLVTGLIVRM